VRPTIHLVCALHFHVPTGVSAKALNRAVEERYRPLITAIEGHRQLRMNLHFAGPILQHLKEHEPAMLSRLRELSNEGRIELLGGAFHDAVLPSIPEQDALSQLQLTANFHKQNLGKVPAGAWMCLRAWDPALPSLLRKARVEYTLLDDAQFVAAGLDPSSIHGHFVTERSGDAITVFPVDRDLSRTLEWGTAEQLRARLEQAARLGAAEASMARAANGGQTTAADERLEVIAVEADRILSDGLLEPFFAMLAQEFTWVKTHTMHRARGIWPSRGRVYVPGGAEASLSAYARPADGVRMRRDFQERMEEAGVWAEVESYLGPVSFNSFLVKYPEADRIHKRMLRVSRKVQLLREFVQAKHDHPSVHKARKMLENVCAALWRAQNHSVYWHGGRRGNGIYDPLLRQRVTRELLAAERIVDRLLGDPSTKGWFGEAVDVDGDGLDEAVIATPFFGAVVHAGRGGTLWELDLRKKGLPIQTCVNGGEEPEHLTGGADTDVSLVDGANNASVEDRPVVPQLEGLGLGRAPRGALMDHFFAPEATAESFAARRFPEVGTFARAAYDLMKIQGPQNGSGYGSILLGKSGVARGLKGVDALLRVERELRFELDRPQMEVHRRVSNRSREAASFWYGLEWSFGIPSGRANSITLKTYGEDEAEQIHRLADGPQDLGEHRWLEWVDPAGGLAVVLELEEPAGIWWCPVRTVVMSPDGWKESIQGHTLVFHRREELWGEDFRDLTLKASFLDA
jgi:4-alpha-glucanotransferase